MGDRKRGLAWLFLIGVGSLIALFVAFLFLLPSILNSDVVKDRMITLASEDLGARLGYEKAELSLFPRPRIVIYQGSLTEPGEMEMGRTLSLPYAAVKWFFPKKGKQTEVQ